MDYSKIKRDLYFGIATLVFSIFYGISTVYTVKVSNYSLDSGRTFPYIITGVLLCLAILHIANCILTIRKIPKDKRVYVYLMNKHQFLRLVLYLGALAIYVLGFMYVGYIVSTAIYLVFLLLFMKAKNKLAVILLTAITPFVLWLFFTAVLKVQFPETFLM